VEAEATVVRGRLVAVDLRPSGVGLTDAAGRYGVQGLQGSLSWREAGPAPPSVLSAAGASLYGLPLGRFLLPFELGPRSLRLLEPVEIPVLEGGLRAEVLAVRMGPEGPEVEFEGGLRALSLDRATEALGWPRFSGIVAGVVPRVRYDRGELRVDGRLLLRVFDGEVVLRDLRVRDLFGPAPTLSMSGEVRRIELDLLTQAFDFGRIEGRLSGRLDDLVLVGWQPVQMSLDLRTPREDPGRRRISQRAVENLTEIGGGMQAAMSTAFLQLFEDFPYRRLGLGCELEGGVCRLSGVADRPDGSFLLVEGTLLPRLDVVGHRRIVDWPELLRRVNAARAGGSAVVE
jgi:hypothetical protein